LHTYVTFAPLPNAVHAPLPLHGVKGLPAVKLMQLGLVAGIVVLPPGSIVVTVVAMGVLDTVVAIIDVLFVSIALSVVASAVVFATLLVSASVVVARFPQYVPP
jgi:hypothetical protein